MNNYLCVKDPPYNAVGDSVFAVGGGADDTLAITQCAADCVAQRKKMYVPFGWYRVTAPIGRIAIAAGYQPGLDIFGDGQLSSGFVADYNGDASLGAIIKYDANGGSKYTVGSELRDFSISQVPGRTGLNGIQLTAAWMVSLSRIKIVNLSGRGIIASLRPDINPISDYYQDFAVLLEQVWVTGCQGWGIDFGAGQSPGLFSLARSILAGNKGGGLRTTTGQCQVLQNLVVENGTLGGGGGIFFDTAEGPSMVARVEQNEVQNNFNYNIKVIRCRDSIFTLNRLLSATYSSTTGGSMVSGSGYMRPHIHFWLGNGAQGEVWRSKFERNLHRSVIGPNKTTSGVIGYRCDSAALSQCEFIHNDFGPLNASKQADGFLQNSSNLVPYCGLGGGGTIVGDGLTSSASCPVVGSGQMSGNDQYCKSLLHCDGADAGTTFTDSNVGGSAKTWTANGNAQLDTAIVKFGTAAGLFDGSGDYVDTPDATDWNLGSGDWTVDFWFNRAGGDGTFRAMYGQVDSGAGAWSSFVRLSDTNVVQAGVQVGVSTSKFITGTTTFTTPGWNHVALVTASGIMYLFVNGVSEGSPTILGTSVVDSTSKMTIGRLGELNGQYWNGSIDEWRYSVGIARWTTNFTPPTEAYTEDLIGQIWM